MSEPQAALDTRPGGDPLQPGSVLHPRGLTLSRQGRFSEALTCFDQALALQPGSLELQLDRANALQALGRRDEALEALDRILACDPNHLGARNNRGNLLQDLGRHGDALADYEQAIGLDPGHPLLHNNRGMALRALGRDLEARASYERAIALEPGNPRPHYNLANLLFGRPASHDFQLSPAGSLLEAIPHYRQALQLDPAHPEAGGNLASVLLELGRVEEAMAVLQASLQALLQARQQAGPEAATQPLPSIWASLLMFGQYLPDADPAELGEQARRWGEAAHHRARTLLGHEPLRPQPDRTPDRPLRIGYVSGDLTLHPVGLFLRCVLMAHDPARITPFLYDNGSPDHSLNGRLGEGARRKGGEHRRVEQLDDLALARLIADDRIDILVDLAGHTARSRLEAFALRPAPLQLSWLGYFASTGLAAIDGLILDPVCAPEPGETAGATPPPDSLPAHALSSPEPSGSTAACPAPGSQCSEPVLRLPHSRFCFQPAPFAPPVAPPPCERNGHISFGSFNNTSKLNAQVLASWARILQAVPRSRLILQWRTFADPAVADALRQTLAELGVAPERLDLRPSIAAYGDFLQAYADLDLALDPFPFSGGQTSCEALWQGVPVLTLPGSTIVSRQTLGFLHCIGLDGELAASDLADYEARAIALAGNPARLAELRRGLRDRMAASPLGDVRGFTGDLERLLQSRWEALLAQGCRDHNPEAQPSAATSLLERGMTLQRQGSLEEAIQTYRHAIRADANQAAIWQQLGTALLDAGRSDAAIEAFRQALRLDPQLTGARNQLDRLRR